MSVRKRWAEKRRRDEYDQEQERKTEDDMSRLMVDDSIVEAIRAWITYALPPGSCTELLLRGQYGEAFKHAHPHIKPHWDDHVKFVEALPLYCRNENYDRWKGMEAYEHRHEMDEELFML